MLQRLDNWRTEFYRFLEERRERPMQYGVNDCGLFVADGVFRMTGTDMALTLRGSYRDSIGAAMLLRRLCRAETVEHLMEYFADKYGIPELTNFNARRLGDVTLHKNRGQMVLGLIVDRRTVSPGETGLVQRPTLDAERIWSI